MSRPRTDGKSGGKAVKVDSVENGISLWRRPDGREFLKVEARSGYGRGSKAKLRTEHLPWELSGGYEEALEAARADVELARKLRLAASRSRLEEVRAAAEGTLTLAEFCEREYVPYAEGGGIDTATWKQYRRYIESWIVPTLGGLLLEEVTANEIRRVQTKMGRPRCSVCDAKQQQEDEAHRRRPTENRGRKTRFTCDECGYGASPQTRNTFLIVLGAVLTLARTQEKILVHPIQNDTELKYRRPGRPRRVTPRAPDLIEPVRAQLKAAHACVLSLELYCLLRPQEALALMYGDALDERGNPRPNLVVSKTIVAESRAGFHRVQGVQVPTYVREKLKTETVRSFLEPDEYVRQPRLWRQVGEEIRALWLANGKPPLTQFIVTNTRGKFRGYPPGNPARWAGLHVRPAFRRAGVHYDANDSNASLRHIGACLLAVGPGWTTREIADYMGNDPAMCARVYQHFYGEGVIDEYRGLQMEAMIDLARKLALGGPTLLPPVGQGVEGAWPTEGGRPHLQLIEGGRA